MLHQCGHSSGGATSFSILFPAPSSKQTMETDPCDYGYSSSSSSVDCTLSLGTPSTRQTPQKPSSSGPVHRSMSTLCWDIISQSGKHSSRNAAPAGAAAGISNRGGDPLLLARRCANCDTTSTPLWRNGPRGPKSLCNACGIRYKKEERRAAAASPSPSPSSSSSAAVAAGSYSYQRAAQHAWSCYAPTVAATAAYCEDGDEEREAAYLSWRLNVVPTNRPSLFQYQ